MFYDATLIRSACCNATDVILIERWWDSNQLLELISAQNYLTVNVGFAPFVAPNLQCTTQPNHTVIRIKPDSPQFTCFFACDIDATFL
jgi:hypothetical protein